MCHRALVACFLLIPRPLMRAEEPQLAQLKPPESSTPLLPVPDPATILPPTKFAPDLIPQTEVSEAPSLSVLTENHFDEPRGLIGRPPIVEPRLFLDGDVSLIIPSLRGERVALPGYQPVAPWRVPGFNAANPNGGYGSTIAGIRLGAGYRFDGGWGEIVVTAKWAGGSHDRWYANGDPRTDWFVQSQLDEPSYDSDGNLQPTYPPIVSPGRPDPLGVAHVTTHVHTSMFDLAYGNGLYETQPAGLRIQAGARWGSAYFEDINEGIGAKARGATTFDGFGPMASAYGELMVLGTGPYSEVSVGLFAQATGSLLFGHPQQIDEEAIMWPNPLAYRYVQTDRQQTVPVYGFSVGIVGRGRGVGPAIMVGYQFEEWKHVGRVGKSNFDLTMHGVFIRCTYNY